MGDFDGPVALVNNAGIGAQGDVSPLSGSATGTVLAVDGGMDAPRLRPRG